MSNDNNIKLLTPPQEQPAQQTYPAVNFQFHPMACVVTVALGPMTSIVQVINEADMTGIAREWLKSRKEVQAQMQLAQNVIRTKL